MTSKLKKAFSRFTRKKKVANRGPEGPIVGFINDRRNGWFRHEEGQLANGFPLSPEDVLIDVGCGDGGVSKFAAEHGARVIATDVSEDAVAKTEKVLRRVGAKQYEVHQSDSNPLPIPDNTCTRVVALEVLEHVEDPDQFMAELVRVAKPGALFLLAVPDQSSELVQQGLAPPAYWERPNHIRIFSREDLGSLVERAGLSIEHREYKSFFWAMWWTLFWAADQELGEREKPVLYHWSQTWNELMKTREADKISKKLDELMPKSQVLVARKAA